MVTGILPGAAALVGQATSTVIGRIKKNLHPRQFIMVARAAFAGHKSSTSVGIKQKRLVCAAAKLILYRQALAVDFVLRSCRACLNDKSECEATIAAKFAAVHVSYSHLWDETQVRAKAKRGPRFR